MKTLLPNPVLIELPKSLLHKIESKESVFYFGNIRLELQGTVLYMKIQTWKGLESAFNAGADLKPALSTLKHYANRDIHRILIMKLEA